MDQNEQIKIGVPAEQAFEQATTPEQTIEFQPAEPVENVPQPEQPPVAPVQTPVVESAPVVRSEKSELYKSIDRALTKDE